MSSTMRVESRMFRASGSEVGAVSQARSKARRGRADRPGNADGLLTNEVIGKGACQWVSLKLD